MGRGWGDHQGLLAGRGLRRRRLRRSRRCCPLPRLRLGGSGNACVRRTCRRVGQRGRSKLCSADRGPIPPSLFLVNDDDNKVEGGAFPCRRPQRRVCRLLGCRTARRRPLDDGRTFHPRLTLPLQRASPNAHPSFGDDRSFMTIYIFIVCPAPHASCGTTQGEADNAVGWGCLPVPALPTARQAAQQAVRWTSSRPPHPDNPRP